MFETLTKNAILHQRLPGLNDFICNHESIYGAGNVIFGGLISCHMIIINPHWRKILNLIQVVFIEVKRQTIILIPLAPIAKMLNITNFDKKCGSVLFQKLYVTPIPFEAVVFNRPAPTHRQGIPAANIAPPRIRPPVLIILPTGIVSCVCGFL